MIARVLLEIKAKSIDKTFDYIIPEHLISKLGVGMRVTIPFGNQKLEGYCLEILEKSEGTYELKEILEVLDEEAVLNKELLNLGPYLKKHTLSSLSSIYSTMLPVALKAKKSQVVSKKYESIIRLNTTYEEAINKCKNEVQKEIISLFDISPTCLKKEATSISLSATNTLLKHGMIKEEKQESYRYQIGLYEQAKKKLLTKEQEQAKEKILSFQNQSKTIVVHGVTGSGKTEIYMQVIEEIRKEKKQALILIPEISLTPQFIEVFAKRFNNEIAVLHSGLSNGEKYDEWRKIMRKEVSIVIGARSAIFAPIENLGIIIIDECHSESYKQENSPKYHAIDVAMKRSNYHNCPLVLGSATPSLEIMARAQKNVFELVSLKKRALNNPLPTCYLVDKKESIKKGHSVITKELEEKIKDRLQKKEQIMILLNRRGHSTVIECSSCGFTYQCPYCDITLTYHKTSKNLRCHYCGYTKYIDHKCPKCHEEALNYYGLGTEKLESVLKSMFPMARLIRMDTDTTSKKGSLKHIVTSFKEQKYDILIGTQMISKGLDFPNVTLVGIVSADSSLNIPDFRSGEKTFALLYQASGRAGRNKIPGEVLIETFNKDNKILNFVANQDYEGFYQYEMQIRKRLRYPPYYYLAQIKIKSKEYELAKKKANLVVSFLKKHLSPTSMILGPSTSNLFRINNIYHFEILIKYRKDEFLLKTLKELDELFILNKKVEIDIDLSY